MALRARQLSRRSPRTSTTVPDLPVGHERGGFGTSVALAVFLPVWLSVPLNVGEFSFAFAAPFVFALWALTQPSRPGSFGRAVHGGNGRGLWVEALCVGAAVLWAFISMLNSPEPLRAFRVILPMSYAICALILLSRVSLLRQRRLILAVLFSGVVVLGVALLLSQTPLGRSTVMRDYRFRAFFENSNQLGVVLLAVWPLAIALLLNATTARRRLICTATVMVLASATFISGTKTALALGFVSGAMTWLYHQSRSGSLDKTLLKLGIAACAIVLAVPAILWVMSWANPLVFKRVDKILTDGVWQYTSIQTRNVIWQESIRVGLAHPLLGGGAGSRVLGEAHSHNMFADYFRGMGVVGLAAAVTLVVSAVSRGANFLLSTWHKGVTDRASDTIVAGMYLGAIFYLIGNQISDSFSPTTAFLFWIMYLGAYLTALPATSVVVLDRPYRQRPTRQWRPRAKRAGPAPGAAAQPT